MSLPPTIRRLARNDIDEAYQWYERQRAGLGEQFLLAVEETIERIRNTPEMHQVVHRDLRRSLVRRFPYGVFYRVLAEHVVVVAVCNCKRHPKTWQARR